MSAGETSPVLVPRPDRQAVEVVACADGSAGILKISGRLAISGEVRFSDFCNRTDADIELTAVRAEMVARGKSVERTQGPSLQLNPAEVEIIWTDERRRGGDPSLRLALESRTVRLLTASADIVGNVRLPPASTGLSQVLAGRNRFITLSPARVISPHLPREGADGLLEVCLVNRGCVVAVVPALPDALPGSALRCTRLRCTQPVAGSCAYTDRTGASCGTTWCKEHGLHIGEEMYCERHHEVMLAMRAAAGTLGEFRPPLVSDRTLSLTQFLWRALDPLVRELLEPVRADIDGAVVSVDQNVRLQFLEGAIAWERGWGVAVPQGYVSRILIRVLLGEPPVVKLIVNRREVFSDVPDWISRRLAGQAVGHDDQQAFVTRLFGLAAAGMASG